MRPLVSIVIPTFNRCTELQYAIESVLAQDLTEAEIIVVDDGSTDDTVQIVRRHSSVHLVSLPRTAQLGAVRNAGIARASGQFVAFLDSDDAWEREKLSIQIGAMARGSNVVASGTNAFVVSAAGSRSERLYFPRRITDLVISRDALIADNPLIVSTVAVRAEALRRVGGFATKPLLHGIEDYDLWLRLSLLGDVLYHGAALASYTDVPTASMRGERSRAQEILGLLVVMSRHARAVGEDATLLDAISRRVDFLVEELVVLTARPITRLLESLPFISPRGLRVWFGSERRPGMLTIGRRLDKAADSQSSADAFVDIDELWFPERSLEFVATSFHEDGDLGAITHVGEVARGWLWDRGRFAVELDSSGPSNARDVVRALETVGFALIRFDEVSGRLDLGVRR